MKKTFYWDEHVGCFDCQVDGQDVFWTWTDDDSWDDHRQFSGVYTLGDVRVPDTCLILLRIPVGDENFLR